MTYFGNRQTQKTHIQTYAKHFMPAFVFQSINDLFLQIIPEILTIYHIVSR